MISEKMIELTKRNSVIRAMFEEGLRLATLHGRENVYDFSLGNPNFPAPKAVNKTIIDLVSNEDPITLHGYMTTAGFPEVRSLIADSINKKFETSFDANNLILAVGAAGALNVVLKTLLNPGDEVIVISPYFVDYINYIENYDGKPVTVPSDPNDFQPDPDAIRSAITAKTKALIINSPNNPTGVIYSRDVIEGISKALSDKEKEFGSPIYIISDEPYREIAYDGAEVPFLTKYYKNTIVCYSWSKSLSLPGQRIGYILVPSEADYYELIFEAACIATRIMGFVNAPALIQKVVSKCLDEHTDISSYDENRKLLYNGLSELGFEPVYPQGAFYLWVKTPCDDKVFAETAKKYHLLVVPGTSFACPGYVRIAYCVSKKMIENSMPMFKKLADELGV